MLALVLAILAKLVVILKRKISKRPTSVIFLNIYTPLQHDLTNIILLCFENIDKPNSKFDLKVKEALHIICRNPNLNAQQNHLALFTIASFLRYSFLCLFCCCY